MGSRRSGRQQAGHEWSHATDELQRSIYVDRFRLAFHTHRGAAFQDWFVRLAGYALGADFEEVRPYGPRGDLRCLSSETKCNTPRRFDIGKVVQDLKECCHAILRAQAWIDQIFLAGGALGVGRNGLRLQSAL